MASTWENIHDNSWQVIGGATKGGIIVRQDEDKASEEASERLSTGSIIKVLEKTDTRVRYELLLGEGPKSGWVNTTFNGKDLLTQLECFPINLQDEALREYCVHFGEQQQQKQEIQKNQHQSALEPGRKKSTFTWPNRERFEWKLAEEEDAHVSQQLSKEQVQQELEQEALKECTDVLLCGPSQNELKEGFAEDSDGDEVSICQHCSLPLGEIIYTHGKMCVHGECAAQIVAQEMKSQEQSRIQSDRDKKQQQRAEYDIGWDAKRIPRNDEAASKLAMREIPQGMVCLVFDEREHAISVASTIEPAAAVNLEYLSIALQVRRQEGHEPVFSLDPVDAADRRSMQEKVFVPAWLAGTSVGDVLFQADYHLKELSMGECEQPVIGMKSCFESAEIDRQLTWNAREWFLVRKAEVQMSNGSVLIPMVKMGVEAREQTLNGTGLEDKPVTCANHPMAEYAASFTKNFDLIAERKSVIYHLRELAKASVLAKFLLDAQVQLEEAWFSLGSAKEDSVCLQVPQLWNERLHSQIQVGEGRAVRNPDAWGHSVYGGVQFGLEKFALTSTVSARTSILPVPEILKKMTWSASASSGVTPIGLPKLPVKKDSPPVTLVGPGKYPSMPTISRPTMEGARFLPPSASISAFSLRPAAPDGGAALPVPSLLAMQPKIPVPLALELPTRVPEQIPLSVATRVPPPIVQPITGAPVLAALTPSPGTPAVRQVVDLGKEKSTFAPFESTAYTAGIGNLVAPSVSGVDPTKITAFNFPERSLRGPSARLPMGPALSQMAPVALQGVDLRLDNFDLSSPKRISAEERPGSWLTEFGPLDDCVTISDAFWSSIDESNNYLKNQDKALLQEIFKPALTDRRSDADLFIPPDTSFSYVEKLRQLVKEEEGIRNLRKEHFFSKSFLKADPGNLFPQSWSNSIEISRGRVPVPQLEDRPESSLHSRQELIGDMVLLFKELSNSLTPIFDSSTEEGTRFRIYSVGSLELRTSQEPNGEEIVGAIYSIRDSLVQRCSEQSALDEEHVIVKITEYVERAVEIGQHVKGVRRRFYLIIETDHGDKILTERTRDGQMTWVENPEDLEDRNSLAKMTRTEVCKAGVTLQDMKSSQAKWAEAGSTPSRKRYATAVFNKAVGARGVDTGAKNITMGLPFMKKFRQQQAQSRVGNQMPFEKPLRGARPTKQSHGVYDAGMMYTM